jgi:hypothetical protein
VKETTKCENLKYCDDDTEAELVKLYLEFEEIPFEIAKPESRNSKTSRPSDEVVIRVPQKHLKRAKAALARYKNIKGVPLN